MANEPLTPYLLEIFDRLQVYDPKKDYISMMASSKTIWDKLNTLRNFYKDNEAEIINLSKNNKRKFFDIFFFDFDKFFSPIELLAWDCLRKQKIVLYPQYPALNYILDFGNPHLKIGLELDGKEFHQNKEKDRDRDQKLFDKEGWKIFRIKGSEAFETQYTKPIMKYNTPCGAVYEYFHKSMEGIIEAIDQVYFYSPDIVGDNEQCIYNTCVATLECHQYARFSI